MKQYAVTPLTELAPFQVTVPGSKSITNRALLLAALADSSKPCTLTGVLFSDDSRAFLDCLIRLGFTVTIDEPNCTVTVHGQNGTIPAKEASIQVRSAGTAARFLSALLGLSCGNYTLYSSEQMKKRPMAPLLAALTSLGTTVQCLEQEGHFPFCLSRKKEQEFPTHVSVDVRQSSQFLSALLMSGVITPDGLSVTLDGQRSALSYITMTLRMMEQFGVTVTRKDNCYTVPAKTAYVAQNYAIEPDVSAACYFYAMAALFGTTVTVPGVFYHSLQGDVQFIKALEQLGCTITETPDGLSVTGPKNGKYEGITIDMNGFSDQTMTMAALAVFANSPTHIKNVAHIRLQESDRMTAIITECRRIGAQAQMVDDGTGILITPAPLHGACIQTYEDHRMAMAFSLVGLKVPDITIDNPLCCKKTFENYFNVLTQVFAQYGK